MHRSWMVSSGRTLVRGSTQWPWSTLIQKVWRCRKGRAGVVGNRHARVQLHIRKVEMALAAAQGDAAMRCSSLPIYRILSTFPSHRGAQPADCSLQSRSQSPTGGQGDLRSDRGSSSAMGPIGAWPNPDWPSEKSGGWATQSKLLLESFRALVRIY